MIPPEIIKFIREEIARAANVILTGQANNATEAVEDIENMFINQATIEQRPVMHPYGFTSRAKAGTMSVVARQGENLANRVVLGHRDADRPELDAEGEVMLYNSDGDQIYLKSGNVMIVVEQAMVEVTNDEVRIHAKSGGPTKLGNNPSKHAATGEDTLTQLNKIKTYLTAMAAVFSSPIPEAGMGAPSSLGTALNIAHNAAKTNLDGLQAPNAEEVFVK